MKKAGSALIGLVMFVGMSLLFGYIFLFSVKGTDAYACVLEEAERNPAITGVTGEPLEPGFLAFLSSRESQGSTARTIFSTNISGPQGSGRIRADVNQAPVNAFLLLQFRPEGGAWFDVYTGEYPCE